LYFHFRPSQTLVQAQAILDEASRITAHLPNVVTLRTAVDKAARWTSSIDKLLVEILMRFMKLFQ
jgi:hypothetical protein